MIPALLGENVTLALLTEDGNPAVFPVAYVYQVGSALPTATLSMTHVVQGRYEAVYTTTALGTYIAVYIVYDDVGHTVVSQIYTRADDRIIVSNSNVDVLVAMLTRALGLLHENTFIDNSVFDTNGQIISARVRCFNNKPNCDAATDGGSESIGLVATYLMETVYESGTKMKTYKMTKL